MSQAKGLPATIQEYYAQFNKEYPLTARNIRGFVMLNADGLSQTARNQQEWLLHQKNGYTTVEPYFGLRFTGSLLLSAFMDAESLGITVEQCLEMGYDPNVIYRREGTNALHFAVFYKRWSIVKLLVEKHNMSLVKNDGQGKPSFFYYSESKLPVDFLAWLQTRPDYEQIVEANINCQSLIQSEFLSLKAALTVAKEKEAAVKAMKTIDELKEKVKLLVLANNAIEKEIQEKEGKEKEEKAMKMIDELKEKVKLLESESPTLVTVLDKEKEKEKDESVKLVSLKAAIDTTRVFWGEMEEHKQMMKWLDQLVLILESKDTTELKIKKIRSSFQTVAMFGNEKTKQWIQKNQI